MLFIGEDSLCFECFVGTVLDKEQFGCISCLLDCPDLLDIRCWCLSFTLKSGSQTSALQTHLPTFFFSFTTLPLLLLTPCSMLPPSPIATSFLIHQSPSL